MEVKIVTLLFFIVLLQGYVTLEVANDITTNETGELRQSGSHGKCSLVDGTNVCQCDWGFAELNGHCEVCNCGSPKHTCLFNRGLKECNCDDGFYQEHGQCEAVPMLDWEVREKGVYYIILRYFPRNGTFESLVETTYRNVEKEAQTSYYTYVRSKSDDLQIDVGGPGTYAFRCRYFTNLGNSSYTEWYQWHWNDASDKNGCDCGPHGKCSLVDGQKTCQCDWGFAELDGNCEVCNCGSPKHTCHFNKGFKECKCDDGFYVEHGQCEVVPAFDWEVREKGAYYIIFRYFARNNIVDFENPEFVETTERKVELDKGPVISHYTYLRSKAEDVTINVGAPGAYEFRCRYFTKLGNSSYTEWYQFHWNEASNFTWAPVILHPRNYSVVDPVRIITEWYVPPEADGAVTNYKVELRKRFSTTSWASVDQTYVDHVVNSRYFNASFYEKDPGASYKLTVTSRGSGYEKVSAPVYFTAKNGDTSIDLSFITRSWALLLATVLGSVLSIVLLSLCIYCCVKKRKQSV